MFLELTGLFLVFLGYRIAKFHFALRRAIQKLEDGRPEEFIESVHELLKHDHGLEVKNLLLTNLSVGLLYTGRWSEALEKLSEVDQSKLTHNALKTLYLNNRLYLLLILRKYDQARELFVEHERQLAPEKAQKEINLCLLDTIATYRYFFATQEESRRLFEHLLESHQSDVARASTHYFLARLELAQGRTELGMEHLEKTAKLAPWTFFAQEIRDLALGQERIGPPGDGLTSNCDAV